MEVLWRSNFKEIVRNRLITHFADWIWRTDWVELSLERALATHRDDAILQLFCPTPQVIVRFYGNRANDRPDPAR